MIFAHARTVTKVMLGVKNGLNWLACFRRSLETDLARLEDQLKPDKTNRLFFSLSLFLKPFAVVLVC